MALHVCHICSVLVLSSHLSFAEICLHWNNQAEGSVPLSVFVCWIRSDARLYVLWHDEQVEDADQSREDQRQKHSAGEVLVIQLMILETHSTRHHQTQLTHAEKL